MCCKGVKQTRDGTINVELLLTSRALANIALSDSPIDMSALLDRSWSPEVLSNNPGHFRKISRSTALIVAELKNQAMADKLMQFISSHQKESHFIIELTG